MKRKRKKTKARRSIYRYTCTACGRQRWAFVFERAKVKICTKCEVVQCVDDHQPKLFEPNESVRVSSGHTEGEADTHTGTVATPVKLDTTTPAVP
jgi:hypothetical protein